MNRLLDTVALVCWRLADLSEHIPTSLHGLGTACAHLSDGLRDAEAETAAADHVAFSAPTSVRRRSCA